MAKKNRTLCKFLCFNGRTNRKCIVVLSLICFINLLYIFNEHTNGLPYRKRMGYLDVSKYMLYRQRLEPISITRISAETTKSEGKNSKSEINMKTSLGTNLTTNPLKHLTNTAHHIEKEYFSEITELELSKITLKPNFSRMINASQKVSTIGAPYLLENRNLCSSVENLSTLIIVHTSCDHFTRRRLARQTWANHSFYSSIGVFRILFLLGKPNDEKIQQQISEESEKYKDILQGNFIDTYRNLTLKGVMAYKWLSERCTNAKFILKLDDDIVIDMFRYFEEILPIYATRRRHIICNHIYKDSMPIIRMNNSKWFVHHRHFRNLNLYPTSYCSGFMVLFTNDLMSEFYSSSIVTPFFWVDDVYLYGLVPGNVPNVKYERFSGHWHMLDGQKALRCYKNVTRSCDYLALGGGGKGEIEDLWTYIVKRYFLSVFARKFK